MPDSKPTPSGMQEVPTFKGAIYPEFLLEKYLMQHPPPERPFILIRLEAQARETLNFELFRALRLYREMSRDLTTKF